MDLTPLTRCSADTHKTHSNRTESYAYIPIHVDVTTSDKAALTEGTNPQEMSGFDEIRRVAAVGSGGGGGGTRESLIQSAGGTTTVKWVLRVQRLINTFSAAVETQGELRHACSPLHWWTCPLS